MLRYFNFSRQLPPWARLEHAAMRFTIGRARHVGLRTAAAQIAFAVLLTLMISGVVLQFVDIEGYGSLSGQVAVLLFFPAFLAQIVLSASALALTTTAIMTERRRQTWDSLRATSEGVGLVLRAHWSAAVLYRLSGLLIYVYAVRVIMLALFAYDLTAFRGDYLNMLTGTSVPQVPALAGAFLAILTLTATLVLPLSGLGLDAAIGLVAATFARHRVIVGLLQVVLALGRALLGVGWILLMSWAVMSAHRGNLDGIPLWGIMVGYGAFGDWGLRYLHGAYIGELWQVIPYGIFAGVGLLAVALAQAFITDLLLNFAVRRARGIA